MFVNKSDEIEVPLIEEDKQLFEYSPTEHDWPNEEMVSLQKRSIQGNIRRQLFSMAVNIFRFRVK